MYKAKGLFKNVQLRKTNISYLIFLHLILMACGGSQTEQSSETIKKDVLVTDTISTGLATTLAISTGSATGTELLIDDGALEEGTTISLDKVDQPSEFADIASEDSKTSTYTTASSAINVEASNESGNKSLVSPMTLSIPYSTSNLTLALTDIEKIPENICVLHRNEDGELFVFLNNLIEIDVTLKKAKFKSKSFGVYQLIYCGNTAPEGFKNASTEQISAPPPNVEAATFSSYGEKSSLTLTVDDSKYGYGKDKYCLIVIAQQSPKAGQTVGDELIIGSSSTSITSSLTDITIDDLDTSLVADEATVIVALTTLDENEACNYKTGNLMPVKPTYQSALLFHSNKAKLSNKTANGSVGSGDYAVELISFITGAPEGVNITTQGADIESACIYGDGFDVKSKTTGSIFLNTAISGTAGSNLSLYLPILSSTSKQQWEVKVGASCQETAALDHKTSYKLVYDTNASNTYYLTPVSINVNNIGLSNEVAETAFSAADKTNCLELYRGDYGDSTDLSSDHSQALTMWNLNSRSENILYSPWNESKLDGSNPLYDMFVSATTCGGTAVLTEGVNDQVIIQ